VSGLPTTAASGADSDIGDGSDASPPPSIWRNRNFQLVWGGSFVNNVGDWLLMVALPVYVFTATDSGAATAALFVIELAVAVLLGPLGGSIVDRLDLPRTLIVTNLAQAAALLPLLTVTEARVWPAYIVAGVQAALARVNNPAGAALLPRLVARHQLLKANAAMATANSLARLIGAPIGGIAVELGGLRGVVVADGLTFVAVAVATWFVHVTARASDTHGSSNVDETEARPGPGVRAAWPLIRRTKPLPALLSLTAMCQLAQGMFLVLFVVFVVEELGGGGGAVGLIRGTMAVGGIAGGIAIARLARRLDAAVLLAAGLLGMGLVSLITWNMPELSTALWVYMLLFATAGPAGAALSVGILTIAQRETPPAVLGRLFGMMEGADAAGTAIGAVAAGVLVDVVDLRVLLDTQASIYVVASFVAVVTIVNRRSPVPEGQIGGRPIGSTTRSRAPASASTESSRQRRPTIWAPTGSPSASRPTGTDATGHGDTRLNTLVMSGIDDRPGATARPSGASARAAGHGPTAIVGHNSAS
jgi:predicted MFS family arabinose efflux permease